MKYQKYQLIPTGRPWIMYLKSFIKEKIVLKFVNDTS